VKRILVALDSSPRAPMVIGAADQLAALTGATMVVFRAVTVQPDMPRDLLTVTDLSIEEVLLRSARSDLERLTREVSPARLEKLTAEFATPWDGICSAAREERVDLIVIGSHGYGVLDRVLGTTAGKVVNHADRNVLVVRATL
jgi:nucleotide-binding universal stress UspA family protein